MHNTKKFLIPLFLSVVILLSSYIVYAENASVIEEKIMFKTYPFSEPSPIPIMGKIYPYFKFNGYSLEGKKQAWNMVTLENPYIKVVVAPEIGGKVWGAIEKEKDKAFIYYNKVVKFRDIAMRGPWTSGGMEFNFGVIGHTPATATPVDYLTRKNDDGSVSCFLGTMDLPSRLEWRVEVKLYPDKAYFETNSFVFNPTVLNQPCYHWMNAAANASKDLYFYYPDSHEIGHGGELGLWPVNEDGRNVSAYANNNFGNNKSYHILGNYAEYFGGYYKNSDFGYGHWALYDEKPGKKLWIWSLARSGEIWRNLLTDIPGNLQYIEMQTGLLFNQAGSSSSQTPFKHVHYSANESQSFQELWFPVKDIGGMIDGSPYGSMNVTMQAEQVHVGISALQQIDDDLVIKFGGKQVYSKHVKIAANSVFIDSVQINGPSEPLDVCLGDEKLHYSMERDKKNRLSRPLVANPDFDWESVNGLYTTALEQYRQRAFSSAYNTLVNCLGKEPNYNPALALLAEICYRFTDYEKGLEYAKKALANDAYDAGANFIWGVINRELGNMADAKDGFSWASRDMEYRSAAFQQLAEIAFVEKKYNRVERYVYKSLDFNRKNINALKVLAVTLRLQNRKDQAEKVLADILTIDPLNHFARFEKYLLNPEKENLTNFTSMIRNEFPVETYLENMLFYYQLGCLDIAQKLLSLSPQNATVCYWRSYINRDNAKGIEFLDKADNMSPFLVFPYRQETIPVLTWAIQNSKSWKPDYYLALLYYNINKREKAETLLRQLGDQPDYAPFYLIRYQIGDGQPEQKLYDLEKALQMDPEQWLTWHELSNFYLNRNDYSNALQNSQKAFARFSREKYKLALDYSQGLLYNGKYKKCLDVLKNTTILPSEGARFGHVIYRRACLLYAAEFIKKGSYDKAKQAANDARLYPENLGTGKPTVTDERLEDYITGLCLEKMGRDDQAKEYYNKIAAATESLKNDWSSVNYVSMLAFNKLGEKDKADRLLRDWENAKSDNDIVVQWVKAKLQNNEKEIQQILKDGISESAGTPWNPTGADSEFRIVMDVINAVIE